MTTRVGIGVPFFDREKEIAKIAHLRSTVLRLYAQVVAYKKLHAGLDKGLCDMARENLTLFEENTTLRRLLKMV